MTEIVSPWEIFRICVIRMVISFPLKLADSLNLSHLFDLKPHKSVGSQQFQLLTRLSRKKPHLDTSKNRQNVSTSPPFPTSSQTVKSCENWKNFGCSKWRVVKGVHQRCTFWMLKFQWFRLIWRSMRPHAETNPQTDWPQKLQTLDHANMKKCI